MSSVNKAILIGHVGKDPEIRFMADGKAIASFSIATSENWKDKNGEKQVKTDWHNITIFGKLAEIVQQYVKKGQLLYVEGKITTDKYTDKSGVEKYSTKIIVDQMQMLGGKQDGTQAEPKRAEPVPPKKDVTGFEDFVDNVPF